MAVPSVHCACAVSIYASRESVDALQQTVLCALRAAEGMDAVIDVLVNGNEPLARDLADDSTLPAAVPSTVRLRVWFIALGDKAYTWNEYVHRIAPVADVSVFVDGYARLAPGALASLAQTLASAPEALAATGLPRYGRSARRLAEQMRREGGLHGNLYALGAAAMAQLQRLGFRLPLGLYRNDSTLGAALAFGLGLFERSWRPRERIAIDERAAWAVDTPSWYRLSDLRAWLRRRRRQAQGALENAAVKQRYARDGLPFESLPETTAALIAQWAAAAPAESARLLKRHAATARALASADVLRATAAAPHRCLLDIGRKQPEAAAAAAKVPA